MENASFFSFIER